MKIYLGFISAIYAILTLVGWFLEKEVSTINFTFIICSIYFIGYFLCRRIDKKLDDKGTIIFWSKDGLKPHKGHIVWEEE